MLDALMQQLVDMLIIERVETSSSVTPHPDQAHIPEGPEVMTDRGLAHSQQVGQIAHIPLPLGKHPDDPNPGSIAQGLKGVGQERKGLLRFQRFSQLVIGKSIQGLGG